MLFRTTAATIQRIVVLLVLPLLLGACGSGTDAGESLSTSGEAQVLRERPPSVVPNEGPESDSVMYLLPETTGYELKSPLAIDARAPDTLDGSGQLIDDSLAAGTTVDSYLLHFDKVGSSNQDLQRQGTLTLSVPLVGLIIRGKHLSASDGRLGASGVKYPESSSLRAPEIGRTSDKVVIGPDRRTLDLDFTTNVSADQMRILLRSP